MTNENESIEKAGKKANESHHISTAGQTTSPASYSYKERQQRATNHCKCKEVEKDE